MADSPADRRRAARRIVLATAACAWAACIWPMLAVAAGPQQRQSEDVIFDGTGVEINYRTNSVSARDVVITQGDCVIQAAEAQGGGTGLRFESSTWDFRGDVRIRCRGGSLNADQATVNFQDNRLMRSSVCGKPASFEQQLENVDKPARGRAGCIQYDFDSGNVHLEHDAWLAASLSDNAYEMRSDCIVYNMRERGARNCSVGAGDAEGRPAVAPAGTDSGRVRLRIRPGENPEPLPLPPAPQPPTPQTAPPGRVP